MPQRGTALPLCLLATALATTAAYAPIDLEPATYAEMARQLASIATGVPKGSPMRPPPELSPPPSPQWTKFEQQYAALQNETCSRVLKAAPAVAPADASAFMATYKGFNGTGASEDPVFAAALRILEADSVDAYLGLPDSFQAGGVDADLVTCAMLSEATPAGLATFCVNSSSNPALITQLLDDVILMRDMLVAGSPRASAGKRGELPAAQYGAAMKLYTQMLKESSTLADLVAPKAATCTFHAGCDYGKGSRESGPATSKEECCSLCANRGSCAAGVFSDGVCWYKTADDIKKGCTKAQPTVFGCVVPSIKPGPPPAPPPPPPPPPPPSTCATFKTAATCPIRCAWTKAGACTPPPVPPPVVNPWDSRDQTTVLKRMALGTALEHAVPIVGRWNGQIDAVARYLAFEQAYKAGELDPAFEVLTTFEQRRVTAAQAPDADLAWMRETMSNYRPDHVVWGDYHWRYSESVHTEVSYGDPTWPDGRPSYRDIAAAGGVCGPRAWFGRFCKRAFGLPTWGAAQPGHAAMTSWAPEGWAVQLGAAWPYCTWEGRGGMDFHLEVQAREHRGEYQKVLRAGWLAAARGDAPVSQAWKTSDPKSLGTGGLWNAIALYAKKYSVQFVHNNTQLPRPIGPSVVPTKVDALIAKSKTTPAIPPVGPAGPDGTITIPAVSFSSKNRSAGISIMASADDGWQILHGGGGPTEDPAGTSWSYEVEADADATMYLTANITTWHMQTLLNVHTSTSPAAGIPVPVYYTVGFWNQTQPIEIKLLKGKNVLTFDRGYSSRELVFKEFFLYKNKPDIEPPPTNHTPTPPAPSPPASEYIVLPPGTDCVHQGITNLDANECQLAANHFGFKDTGSRSRESNADCFTVVEGQYKGNANFNTNKSPPPCCDKTVSSICLRK